jgi:hydroxyacylglutathione hydrolase
MIKTIPLVLPLHMGYVNCYLLAVSGGFILIDTGSSNVRQQLYRELESAGCSTDTLKLILITHGDFDHTGNAASLRSRFGTRVAMHPDDAGMAELGDMFVNRKKPNVLVRALVPRLTGFGKSERFTPDVLVEQGYDLSPLGLAAKVLHLPGHSAGSIGLLTGNGELFCGDLFENVKGPKLNSIMDDPASARISLSRLQSLEINTVYPGHGRPFPMAELVQGLA